MWTQLGAAQTITITDPVYIGLGVCSGVSGTFVTATFDNVLGNRTKRVRRPHLQPGGGYDGSAQNGDHLDHHRVASIDYTTDGTTPSKAWARPTTPR